MADDPFYIVKDELCKSLSKIRILVNNLNSIKEGKVFVSNSKDVKVETVKKIINELKNTIKGVDWDLQDLTETINIAEKNPQKFKLSASELDERRKFISTTKDYIEQTKPIIDQEVEFKDFGKQNSSVNIRIPDLLPNGGGGGDGKARYIPLNNNNYDDSDAEIDNDSFIKSNNKMKQEQMFKQQDNHLDLISGRINSLKQIGQTMNTELESQAELLNDLGSEMDIADGRMQTVMKKLTKLLHLSSDKGQWTAIGILLGAIVVIIILFNVIPSRK